MTSRTPPKPDDASKKPGSGSPGQGTVKIQKREVAPLGANREKLCAECGRPFALEEDQKFFMCPACYRRRFARKPARKGETQVLIRITCVDCGVQDYLDFMPADPTKAYCKACFGKRKREPNTE